MKRNSMKTACCVAISILALLTFLCAEKSPNAKEVGVTTVAHPIDAGAMRVQGEQRYRANCGRCHATPQKFPPRMMATVLRHMRVRATITDEDMKLVLFYMTQ